MPRKLLSVQEIRELTDLLCQVFGYITSLKSRHALAEKIKYPQIPSILTESLAIHLLDRHILLPELEDFNFNFGGRVADVLAVTSKEQKKIEVKATGKSAFEYFGEKDVSADVIIWVHFAEFFMDTKSNLIKVYTILNPSKWYSEPIKITLDRLKKDMGPELKEIELDVNKL